MNSWRCALHRSHQRPLLGDAPTWTLDSHNGLVGSARHDDCDHRECASLAPWLQMCMFIRACLQQETESRRGSTDKCRTNTNLWLAVLRAKSFQANFMTPRTAAKQLTGPSWLDVFSLLSPGHPPLNRWLNDEELLTRILTKAVLAGLLESLLQSFCDPVISRPMLLLVMLIP